MNKALLTAFTERAEQKSKSRAECKKFEFPGVGELLFNKLTQRGMIDLMGVLAEAERRPGSLTGVIEAQIKLVYDCCPMLQDDELHKALGVLDPYDTVLKLLDVTEAAELANKLGAWMGVSDADEETVKN